MTQISIKIYTAVLLISIALSSVTAWSSTGRCTRTKKTGSVMASSSSSSIGDRKEDPTTTTIPSPSRRNFLLLASSAVTATATATTVTQSQKLTALPGFRSNKAKPMSIAQAVQWIDDNCDRRFLHAVVASDYRFLYRGISSNTGNSIATQRLTPDLLTEGTYGDESAAALKFFQNIQEVLKDDAVNPSNGHLATSSVNDAAEWGVPASVWPVDGAHYAWFQDRQLFFPRPNYGVVSKSNNAIRRDDFIVDGKDCGRESLEDALRAESCEVMVASGEFMVVPAGLDEALRDALKKSFLV